MNILVMGAGALGGYFGARLAADGHDVTFVARGAHLAAMRAHGLRVESRCGDLHLETVQATDDPSGAPTPDVVLFMVKNYDVEPAARQVLPVLGPETLVITCQNGISAPERLAAVIGGDRVSPGVVYMPADIKEPGVIRHPVDFHRLVVGPQSGQAGVLLARFAEAVNAAGPVCEISADIHVTLWEKFIMLSSFSALTALTRLDIGPIREVPMTCQLLLDAVDEAEAVARADCPSLPEGVGGRVKEFMLNRLDPNVHASMQDDLLRGRRIEVNFLSGDIVRLGQRYGVPTPVHGFVTAALQPFANGRP